MRRVAVVGWVLGMAGTVLAAGADERFERLAARFVDEYPALSPVGATLLGDHRFDGRLDEVSAEARRREAAFCKRFLAELERIRADELSRPNRVDRALLRHRLEGDLWRLEELQEWAWNPLVYSSLGGNALYGLLAREFAPLAVRLEHAAARLEALPAFLGQVRVTLVPARVPEIHARTAVAQNKGMLSILDEMVEPRLDEVPAPLAERLRTAMTRARTAVDEHQVWLEKTLLPAAKGDFRLGRERFERKLSYALASPLGRAEIRRRAEAELERVRGEMYEVAQQVYRTLHPYTAFPAEPTEAYRQAIIRAALEVAASELPRPDELVDTARRFLEETTAFVRQRDLVTVPDDPLEIIVMPEFQRGVAVAYCDSPGPLDVGQKTYYAVAPLPADWTPEQVRSFLREYNLRSLRELTIHEAMPGHFLQIAHANRYPSTLRALLGSEPFVEGWAVYAERLMVDAGYLDGDPLMRLVRLKWYLRSVTNAILDQAVHVDGISREDALRLMVEDAFQEEREAAGKWVRAQLTAAQLSTYFVGYQEHADLRAEVEAREGSRFDAKRYHDRLLSFGSPPVEFARALLLDLPLPEQGARGSR